MILFVVVFISLVHSLFLLFNDFLIHHYLYMYANKMHLNTYVTVSNKHNLTDYEHAAPQITSKSILPIN